MLDNLPPHILEVIMKQKSLDFHDLINLSSTCSYMRAFILTNDLLWKYRYLEKWPEIESPEEIDNYLSEIRHVHGIRRNVNEILVNYATHFMNKEHLSHRDFKPFFEIINSRHLNKEYIENYLREILNDHSEINTYDVVSLSTPGNLTLKYYSLETLRYLNHFYLEETWKEFNLLKDEDQLLEIGAAMLTQWFKPQCDIRIKNIRNQLDKIAEEVKEILKISNPNHPLFKTTENDLRLWQNKNIYENKFSSLNCKEILETMRHVIFQMMDFGIYKKESQQQRLHINNLFITDVLETKKGSRITLSIIYEGVARRLGVNLEPMNSFLLKFVEHEEIYYVDVYNRGLIVSAGMHDNDLIRISGSIASTRTVIAIMVFKLRSTLISPVEITPLTRSILELNYILDPNVSTASSLAYYYKRCGIDTTTFQVNHILHSLSSDESHSRCPNSNNSTTTTLISPFLRNLKDFRRLYRKEQKAEFAVGMVMKHKLYNYTCVIYGWDPVCNSSSDLKPEMKVNQLKYGLRQPFYYVLLDYCKRYVAQENLIFSGIRTEVDKNPEIGRYFTHFFKNQYVPNLVKNDEYPNDFQIRIKYR